MGCDMNKSEQAMADVINALQFAGFVEDGATREEVVRVPTTNSPLFGKIGKNGGALALFGGRMRFAKTGTNIKATVGKRTTSIYRIEGSGPAGVRNIATYNTIELPSIKKVLTTL